MEVGRVILLLILNLLPGIVHSQVTVEISLKDSTLVYEKNSEGIIVRSKIEYEAGDSAIEKGFYSNGNIKYITHLRNGMIHGECRQWYESGKLKEVSSWINGEGDGAVFKFSDSGNIQYKYTMSKGKAEGEFIEYHENGRVRLFCYFEDGEKTGLWLKYLANGQICEVKLY